MNFIKLSKVAAAAGIMLASVTSAQATVALEIRDVTASVSLFCDTSLTFTASNCGAGFIATFGGSFIAFTGNVGGFNISFTNFVSNTPGTPGEAILNGSTTQVERIGAGQGQLQIDLKGFNYLYPAGELKTLSGSASLTSSDTAFGSGPLGADRVFSRFLAAGDNLIPGVGDPETFCSIAISTNNSCGTGQLYWTDADGGFFSMRDVQLITLSEGKKVNTTVSGTVSAVPEPMTLSLVGAGLLGAAAVARRRAKKAA